MRMWLGQEAASAGLWSSCSKPPPQAPLMPAAGPDGRTHPWPQASGSVLNSARECAAAVPIACTLLP